MNKKIVHILKDEDYMINSSPFWCEKPSGRVDYESLNINELKINE